MCESSTEHDNGFSMRMNENKWLIRYWMCAPFADELYNKFVRLRLTVNFDIELS